MTRIISALICFASIVTAGMSFCAEKDVYDYEAQKNAPAGTKRIVFICAKGTHGGRGSHEFQAGGMYFARRINALYPNAYAVVYTDDKWPRDLSNADAIIVLLNHAGKAAQDINIKAAVDRSCAWNGRARASLALWFLRPASIRLARILCWFFRPMFQATAWG